MEVEFWGNFKMKNGFMKDNNTANKEIFILKVEDVTFWVVEYPIKTEETTLGVNLSKDLGQVA